MQPKEPSKGRRRQEAILQLLKQRGRITVQEILDQFQCSEATARRDLDALESSEGVIRTLGGAVYDVMGGSREIPFAEKKDISWLEKESIADKAVSLVSPGDVVGLSGGTTTFLIARALKALQGITVVTNAVNIAMELADAEDIQVVVTGGIMRRNSFELCGPLAEKVVDSLNVGKMFLGIDGINVQQGVMMYSELESEISKMLIRRSVETYAVFDASKIGRTSLFSCCPLASLHGCVTNALPDPSFAEALERSGIAVHLANDKAASI